MEEYCGTEAMEVPILQVTEEYNALLAAATAAGCFPVWTFLPPCQRDLLRDPAANPSEDSLIALMDHSWLVGDDDTGLRADDSSRSWEPGREWSVGRYRDGSLLVHSTRDGGYDPMLLVYDDFRAMEAAAAKDGIPANVLAETATALGLELKDRNGI
jgi:hypothetical protein